MLSSGEILAYMRSKMMGLQNWQMAQCTGVKRKMSLRAVVSMFRGEYHNFQNLLLLHELSEAQLY